LSLISVEQTKISIPSYSMEEIIQKLHEKDTDEFLREELTRALGEYKHIKAVDVLISTLNNPYDPYDYITKASIQSLVKIGDIAIKPLINALNNSNWKIALNAAKTLGMIKDTQSIKPLISIMLKYYGNEYNVVSHALVQFGTSTLELLIFMLQNSELKTSEKVITILGNFKDVRAVNVLISILKNHDCYMSKLARRALIKIGPTSVEPLIMSINDTDYRLRAKICRILGNLRDNRAVEPLIVALSDSHKWIRTAASKALGNLRDKRALIGLIKALEDQDKIVQMTASKSLGKLKDERALESLTKIEIGSNKEVRVVARKAIDVIQSKPKLPYKSNKL
jgi:HEAT repeat protein